MPPIETNGDFVAGMNIAIQQVSDSLFESDWFMGDEYSVLPDCVIAEVHISPGLESVLLSSRQIDPVERTASFGRWWLDALTGQLVLSGVAAELLDVDAGFQSSMEVCFSQVVPEDVLALMNAVAHSCAFDANIECELRVINEFDGMRWLRMVSIPPSADMQGIQTGMLINVTASRNAAMRERLGFESTQFLVGTGSLGEAVTRVIQSVCENLGWECGAYWAMEPDVAGGDKLACKYFWHDSGSALDAFSRESRRIRIAPGEGWVGRVWSIGQASWVENIASGKNRMLRSSARESGLQSGYAFPVSFVMADGRRYCTGVLEFFSNLSRQREAQLPNLASAIGALVAQTAQRIEQTETIRRMAQMDGLTGLANRSHIHELTNMACLDAEMRAYSFGVMYIDLDHFKPINDAYGHDAGNFVLLEFAKRLSELAPTGCHIGRLGGDEFAILTHAITSREQLDRLAEKVLVAANTPFQFGAVGLSVSASIGISVYPENGKSMPELLRTSDAAMYRSKNSGRNGHCFYSGDMPAATSAIVQQLTMEVAMHHALLDNEFFLEYQPVFDSFGEHMVAVEALIRWRRPNGEIVRPDTFIPIAEKSRLILQIGRWVVKQACSDLAKFHQAGLSELKVHVNMTAAEFTGATLPQELAEIAKTAGVNPSHICLELTEGMVMQHADRVIPVMKALRKLGFQISLDDFGMGYSSLSRLKRLPITSLKIDRSFVRGVPHECGDCSIVRTIFDLGFHMKLQIVAEGIENDAQLIYLRQFGYPLMQGFLLAKPMPAAAIMALYANSNHVPEKNRIQPVHASSTRKKICLQS